MKTKKKLFPSANTDSVLESIYFSYSESNCFENVQAEKDFSSLNFLTNKLSTEELDALYTKLSTVCASCERTAFLHGMKVGVLLAGELQ